MSKKRPNILILMTDQQRADCLSCAGHPQLRTPNMDRIAAEGVRFSHACTDSPVCMPARHSFISGHRVHRHGVWSNGGELPADYESFFRRLQTAGYYTAHIGKSHYYPHGDLHMRDREPWMHERGFDHVDEIGGPLATCWNTESHMTDRWREKGLYEEYKKDYEKRFEVGRDRAVWPSPLPVEEHADSYVGRKGVEFIRDYDEEKPFCAFVGFGGPHEPWDAPGEYATMYDPDETPPRIDPETAQPGPWVPEHAAKWQTRGRRDDLTEDVIRRFRANYYGKITLIDDWFGRILDACEGRGLLDDMVVLFWSDHGEMLGDHGRVYKCRFYESALRVPLMVRGPSVLQGAVSPALAQTVDIMPTVLEAAGVEPPGDCDGLSLWPVLRDPDAHLRGAALSEVRPADSNNAMVRTERWKLAAHEDGTPYMLHDLREDPKELNNLVGHPDYAEVQAEMEEQLHGMLPG
ncbi:MAG: sulfatase-like hydrolase/transferase [Candidatus Brocadiia bacterium]